MKKIFCLLLCALMLLGLCACGGGSGEKKEDTNGLKAGFARLDCIPDDPLVHIAGGVSADDPATDGLLDNLAVTCIALQKGEETVLIFACDIVDVTGYYKKVESSVSGVTGVPASNIFFGATHTHSAPTLKDSDSKLPGRDNYEVKYVSTATETAQKAIADLSPVGDLSYGSIMTEDMVRVRHYMLTDGTTYGNGHGTLSGKTIESHLYDADEECQVIRISRPAEDKKDIVMFNLGAHGTIVSGTHTSSLSADFPFPARTYVEENADVHAAYFLAAAGDQVPSSRIATEVKNKKDHFAYGEQLGGYVVECLNNMTASTTDTLARYDENYVAKHMKDGIDDVDRLKKANEITTAKSMYGASSQQVKDLCKEYGFDSHFEASGLVNRSKTPAEGHFPIGAMLLGDIGITFFPGEPFGAMGRQLKDNSPTPFTFVITCTEDDQGYFPTEIAKEHGFYEYGQTKYAMGTGEAVMDRYCEILTALKDGTEVPAQATP